MIKAAILITLLCSSVGVAIGSSNYALAELPSLPAWIKNNAKWWADGQIGDDDFIKGLQYLVEHKILVVPQKASTNEIKVKTYSDNTYGFSIEQPYNWERQASTVDQTGLKYVTFIESSTIDTAQTTLILLTVEDMKGLSLDDYLKVSKAMLEQQFGSKSLKLTNESKTMVNGENAYDLEYVLNVGIPFKMKAIIVEHKGKSYLFMYEGEAKSFDRHLDDFDKALSSLKFF